MRIKRRFAIRENYEDYLEAILELEKNQGSVGVTDIAKKIKVSKPTVTEMLKILNEKKVVEYRPYKKVKLTEKGRRIAKKTLMKHSILLDFYKNVLNLDEKMANKLACRTEHIFNGVVIKRIEKLKKMLEA